MNRRLGLFLQWTKHHHDISFFEILKKVLEPTCSVKAQKLIANINEEGEYREIHFKNMVRPFYFPQALPLRLLFQFVAELMFKDSWHYYEIPETTVSKDDIVVDCGAAEGIFGYLTSQRCKHVYAIEPMPLFIKSMMKTFQNDANVTIIPAVLSNETGKVYCSETDHSLYFSSNKTDHYQQEIPVATIDALFFEKDIPVTYLKLDVEGYELKVLQGAKQSIKTYRPTVVCATYHEQNIANELIDFLKGIHPDYKIIMKGIENVEGKYVLLHAYL